MLSERQKEDEEIKAIGNLPEVIAALKVLRDSKIFDVHWNVDLLMPSRHTDNGIDFCGYCEGEIDVQFTVELTDVK